MQTLPKYAIAVTEAHICSPVCSTRFIIERNGRGKEVPNESYKDGRCDKYMTRVDAYCQVAEWGAYDSLHDVLDQDEVVIADSLIKIPFSYPLKRHHTFTFESRGGFTRVQLLRLIKSTYRDIYAQEQATATRHTFHYRVKCSDCLITFDLSQTYVLAEDGQDCPICLSVIAVDSVASRLSCGHVFHNECITQWIGKSPTCPLCRTRTCSSCNGGWTTLSVTDIVPTMEARWAASNLLNRPQSDGFWGIWGHDIGDLVIESLIYDPTTHVLSMHIGS